MKKIIAKLCIFALLFSCIGCLYTTKDSKADIDNVLQEIKGEYVPMFDTLLDNKYNHYWRDYASAIGGASQSEQIETSLKYAVNGTSYGSRANEQLYTGFINDIIKIEILGDFDNTISFYKKDGSSISHKYRFMKEASAGSISGRIYQNIQGIQDDCSIVFISNDTMETTHHIEIRYSDNESDLLNFSDGKLKNWIGMAMTSKSLNEPDEKSIQRAIAYYIYRSIGSQNTREVMDQRTKLTGIWNYVYTKTEQDPVGLNDAKRYVKNTKDGASLESTDAFGDGDYNISDKYTFYMYDATPTDGVDTGLYLRYNTKMECIFIHIL